MTEDGHLKVFMTSSGLRVCDTNSIENGVLLLNLNYPKHCAQVLEFLSSHLSQKGLSSDHQLSQS